MTGPRITSGQLLIATGILHQLVGAIAGLGVMGGEWGRNLYAEIAERGVVGSIDPDPMRMAWFWFLCTGFVILFLGNLLHRLERLGVTPPRSLGWQILAMGLIGGLLIPPSGFWLLVPQGAWLLRRRERAPSTVAVVQG